MSELCLLVHIIYHDYPGFHLKMPLYLCEIIDGEMKLSVHDDLIWLDENNVEQLNWIEATKSLVPRIKEIILELKTKEG
jgi:hypothetical protein